MAAGRRDPQLGWMWAMRTAAGVDPGDADGGRAAVQGPEEEGGSGGRRWSDARRPEEEGERRPAVEQHPAA